MFPAASLARIVIRFDPTSSAICGVVHVVVPVAAPEPPVELLHVTHVTPVLSDAVPEKTIAAAVVNAFVVAGDVMVSVGGVVSLLGCEGFGCAGV